MSNPHTFIVSRIRIHIRLGLHIKSQKVKTKFFKSFIFALPAESCISSLLGILSAIVICVFFFVGEAHDRRTGVYHAYPGQPAGGRQGPEEGVRQLPQPGQFLGHVRGGGLGSVSCVSQTASQQG